MFQNKWITFFPIFLIVLSVIVWISSQNRAAAQTSCEEVSLPDDLIRIERFHNLADKTGTDNPNFNTGVPYPEYMCVAAGWNARYDVDENKNKVNEVWTYTQGYGPGGRWWAHVAMPSDGDEDSQEENPDIDIVCFKNEAPFDIVAEEAIPASKFFNTDEPN